MHVLVALIVGTGFGILEGITIFFAPHEPHKLGVFLGATIKGGLNGMLVGYAVTGTTLWWQGLGYGFLYGSLLSLAIVLPEGGLFAKDSKYILPFSALTGGLIGVIIVAMQ